MARAYAQALPGSLADAASAVGLPLSKDAEGHRLMLTMSRPRRIDLFGNPVWWDDDPARLQRLIEYCIRDVEVERALHNRLFHLTAQEHKIWLLDQEINDRGLLVDRELCEIARDMIEVALKQLNKDIREASDSEVLTTSSVAQIINYCKRHGLKDEDDEELSSIAKEELGKLLARDDLPPSVRRVLEIRQEASKVSVKKIQALLTDASADGRVRGLLAYHAATTGRWAGRRFQPQNIKRPVNKNQDVLIDLVRRKQMLGIEIFDGPINVISDIIRGMIIAAPGNHLFAADFSNIEGRGLAWLVNENWKVMAFEAYDAGTGPDIYKLAYSRAFHVPLDKIDDHMRQIGKVMELALGFQGGIGAFQSMAAVYGVKVSNERADELKIAWRSAHPRTVEFWPAMEWAAIGAVQSPGRITTCGRIRYRMRGPFLYMQLPSGRCLCYPYAKVMQLPTPWGEKKPMLTYKTTINPSNAKRVIKEETHSSHWGRISAYGGLLVENCVQGLARDVMAEAMLRVNAAGYPVVLTVHDEVVAEAPATRSAKEFKAIMEMVPHWAKGFPIAAKAWQGDRYKKD
jgi:DNA polymerase